MWLLLGVIGSCMSCDDFKLSSGEKLSTVEIINRILANHIISYTVIHLVCVDFSKYTVQ